VSPAPDLFEVPYDPAWGYERRFFLDVEHRYTKMHRLLRAGLGDLAGKRVLDLGCCRGLLLERFRRYDGTQLLGLEIDETEISLARERGIEPVRAFVNAFDGNRIVARLPYGDAEADVVLAGEIIEHVVDTEGFLREIKRVLSPGGGVVISTPNVLWWKHRATLLLGRYPDNLEHRLRYGEDFGHVRQFTPSLLAALMEETGFRNVQVRGGRLGPIASVMSTPRPVARALDRLADRLPSLADTIVTFGRT
jgi:2-polyprenyl-3-methyl-5-hydroxy-6-metoxy-1,4-benzoquinol methylase